MANGLERFRSLNILYSLNMHDAIIIMQEYNIVVLHKKIYNYIKPFFLYLLFIRF